MAAEKNIDWSRSVGGIVCRNQQVLLVRHTYGGGKGKLIIPGGYLLQGETPETAVQREIREETSIIANPRQLAGIRFQPKNWYAVFCMEYVSGEPQSDGDENSEALFMDIHQVAYSSEVPDLTRVLLQGLLHHQDGVLDLTPYDSQEPIGQYSLYSV